MTVPVTMLQQALLSGKLLRAAYRGPTGPESFAAGQRREAGVVHRVQWISRGASQVGLYRHEAEGGGLWVVVRGTESHADWVRDFQFWRRPSKHLPGTVHTGFSKHVEDVAADVVDSVLSAGEPVRMAAHSLGAGMAPELLLELQAAGASIPAAVGWGMPRGADRTYAEAFDARMVETGTAFYRAVVVERGVQDLVTRILPSRWGYWHVGRPVLFVDGIVYTDPRVWETLRLRRPFGDAEWWRSVWWTLKVVVSLRRAVDAHVTNGFIGAAQRALGEAYS